MKKEIKIKPIANYLFLILLGCSFIVFFPSSLQQVAHALVGNYSTKATGDSITAQEWNDLDTDFLATDGTNSMQGNINMNGNRITNLPDPAAAGEAASRGWVLNQVGNSDVIADTDGNSLHMVCGRTSQGATNWQQYDTSTVYIDVDFGDQFTSWPVIITSLGGIDNLYRVTGVSSVYDMRPWIPSYPEHNFRLYVRDTSSSITASIARNTYQWFVNWCAIGE